MVLPLTSSIRFLDQKGASIEGPAEWLPALIDLNVATHQWEEARLALQGVSEIPLLLKKISGRVRVMADWPRSPTGHYRLQLYLGSDQVEEQVITVFPKKIRYEAYLQL